ncbi:Hypothetical_protein [Hexamita inflata]|uniref:Hypothetical_protein n=1 Tax=Hexamita inflata TaxID=28002 RepID=A0AA86U9T4_9EUKA|nr:Hypothetical protein HINF_LOCUS31981 [Hexamita inflata]
MFSPTHSQCAKLVTMSKLKYDCLNSNTFIYEWCWALDIYTQLNNIIGKQSKLFQFKFMNIKFQMSFCSCLFVLFVRIMNFLNNNINSKKLFELSSMSLIIRQLIQILIQHTVYINTIKTSVLTSFISIQLPVGDQYLFACAL